MRRLIGITPNKNVFREHERISNLISTKQVTYFHIRKPNFTESQTRDYLSKFDMAVRPYLSLHDYHHLALEMNIGGVHLNARNPHIADNLKTKRLSASCHSIAEVTKYKNDVDYCFLSPIFDSISKYGYKSKFSLSELNQAFKDNILDSKVVALGGVDYNNISTLEKIGFSSFAMLGSLWNLPKIMFITHFNDKFDYLTGARTVLKGGCKFIQLRMKDASDNQVLEVAEFLRTACDENNALLTIDDRIHLLDTNLFDGVHLGKNDMPIKEAKQITDDKFLLGATCNTIEDAVEAIKSGADYLGVGPFRFTTTKQKLSPQLGVAGYDKMIKKLKDLNYDIPIYAIGGITKNDFSSLKNIGVYGSALSGTILSSNDTLKETFNIIQTWNNVQDKNNMSNP